jgi:hypothetical protein
MSSQDLLHSWLKFDIVTQSSYCHLWIFVIDKLYDKNDLIIIIIINVNYILV